LKQQGQEKAGRQQAFVRDIYAASTVQLSAYLQHLSSNRPFFCNTASLQQALGGNHEFLIVLLKGLLLVHITNQCTNDSYAGLVEYVETEHSNETHETAQLSSF
jgi:hypothetical protein